MGWKGGSMLSFPAGKHGYPDPLGTPPLHPRFSRQEGRASAPLSVYQEKGEAYFVPFIKDEGGKHSPPVRGGWHAKTREDKAKNFRIKK